MSKDIKDKSDKECIKIINEKNPIMCMEIRHNSLDVKDINKNTLP